MPVQAPLNGPLPIDWAFLLGQIKQAISARNGSYIQQLVELMMENKREQS